MYYNELGMIIDDGKLTIPDKKQYVYMIEYSKKENGIRESYFDGNVFSTLEKTIGYLAEDSVPDSITRKIVKKEIL